MVVWITWGVFFKGFILWGLGLCSFAGPNEGGKEVGFEFGGF